MTPSPINPSSLPEALAQLKTLLDQGIITAAEYAILKHRLLTTPAPPAGVAPAGPGTPASSGATPATATPAAPQLVTTTAPVPPPPPQELPSLLDMFQQAPGSLAAAPAPAPVPMRPVAAPAPASPTPPPAPVPVTAASVSAAAPAVEFLPPAAPPAPARPEFLPPPAAAPLAPPTPPAPAQPAPAHPTPAPAFSEPAPAVTPAPALPDALARVEARLAEPAAARPAPAAPVRAGRRALPIVLAVLVGLAAVLELGYLLLNRDHPDEHLTSRSKTAADSVAVRPETGPQAEPLTLPPAPEPEVVRTAPIVPPAAKVNADSVAAAAAARRKAATATTAEDAPVFPSVPAPKETPVPAPAPAAAPAATTPTSTTPAPAPAGPATAPEDGDDEATTRARQALASYYADLQAPPFNASQHFAPTVERLYTRQNLTPAAIETELTQSMFPEFKDLNTRIVPGTLRLGPPAADGTRTATYTEQSRAFRVSKGQHQRTRTQVRVRFNPDYKITYMRQEKLLENTFEQ